MIRIRIDDFPHTKDEERGRHSLNAFREFHRCLGECTGNKRYLLGVIPDRCTVDDLLMLRNETDVVVGMHGTTHDEGHLNRHSSQWSPWMSTPTIVEEMRKRKDALESALGKPIHVYMPPRNLMDHRDFNGLVEAGFSNFTTGPETTIHYRENESALDSQPPYCYGRTDELFQIGAHRVLRSMVEGGNDVWLTLHWTWETNIGLAHMRTFFAGIPQHIIASADE